MVTIDWDEKNSGVFDPSLFSDSVGENVIYRVPVPSVRRTSSDRLNPILRSELWRVDPIAAGKLALSRFVKTWQAEGNQFFIRGAYSFLRKHLKESNYDVIWSSSPDLSPHVIASKISQEFDIPWVADCRDDYAVFKEGVSTFVELESRLLKTATSVVTVSKGLQSEIGSRLSRRIEVIENGYEAEHKILEGGAVRLEQKCFNMVYTGVVAPYYPQRNNPKLTFEAVSKFLERVPDAKNDFRLTFFGDKNIEPILQEFRAIYPNIQPVLKSEGRIPRDEAIAIQRAADLLLILAHPGRKGILTGKVFEYLAARKSIFCLPGDKDELDELLTVTNTGNVFGCSEEGADYLVQSYHEWKNIGEVSYQPNVSEVSKYSRENLTMKLGSLFDKVVESSSDK